MAAGHDGLFPVRMPWDNAHPLSPQDLSRAVQLTFPSQPPPPGYDIVVTGRTKGPNAPVLLGALDAYEETGATWWLESMWELTETALNPSAQKQILDRIHQGPPRAA